MSLIIGTSKEGSLILRTLIQPQTHLGIHSSEQSAFWFIPAILIRAAELHRRYLELPSDCGMVLRADLCCILAWYVRASFDPKAEIGCPKVEERV